ncbi:hypothetical protein [Pseudanabaena sp. ABRG5-3]|uniref:hypothetical protein n=1 Tax=Pseudanabaena sp. ABRG5-3 TaxID=685565 RepID=UPI0013A63757|nr:hypothetical protein [Pseudanabaena sp. ABRG5-3]
MHKFLNLPIAIISYILSDIFYSAFQAIACIENFHYNQNNPNTSSGDNHHGQSNQQT